MKTNLAARSSPAPHPADPAAGAGAFAEVARALAVGQVHRALELLCGLSASGPAYWRWLGTALLRSGQTQAAEVPLRRSAALGDLVAEVEVGGWLCLTGQAQRAVGSLERSLAALVALGDSDSDLYRRAERYLSTALFRSGEVGRGVKLAQERCGAVADRTNLSAALTLAQMRLALGELAQACALFQQILAARLPEGGAEAHARVAAWSGLATAQARLGRPEEAALSLERSRALLEQAGPWAQVGHLRAEIELRLWTGEREALLGDLRALSALARPLQDAELLRWNAAAQAEILGRQGQFSAALLVLHELGTRQGLPPQLQAVRGLLMRRQRYDRHAITDLREACARLGPQDQALYWRSQLYLADLQRQSELPEGPAAACTTLRRVLTHLGSAQDHHVYVADFAELSDLVQYALIEPELAPLMHRVLERSQALPVGAAPLTLEVWTLGRAAVSVNGQELAALSVGAVLLLTYLHLHPQRSRNDMQAALFPDFGRQQTTAFFRTAVRELRARLGADILVLDGTLRHPRYQLSSGVELKLDLTELRGCLGQAASKPASLERAAHLYAGPFLPELEPESEWVQQVRSEVRWAFNLVFQQAFDHAQTEEEVLRLSEHLARLLKTDAAVAEASAQLAQAQARARKRTRLR